MLLYNFILHQSSDIDTIAVQLYVIVCNSYLSHLHSIISYYNSTFKTKNKW